MILPDWENQGDEKRAEESLAKSDKSGTHAREDSSPNVVINYYRR
jgi:hypothetical protein